MSKNSKTKANYIPLEEALPKICKWSDESDEFDDIRKEILETGSYYRDELQFLCKDGNWFIKESSLNDWVKERYEDKKQRYFDSNREKYPHFKSNLTFLMQRQGGYTPTDLSEILQKNYGVGIGRSGVSNYCNPDSYHVPERDIMFAIAKQFDCAVEALGEVDIKSLYEQANSSQNYSVSNEDVAFFYPILCEKNDLKNANFVSGMNEYIHLHKSGFVIQDFYPSLQSSMDFLWNAGKEGVRHGYTNWITLFFIGYDGFSAMENNRENKALILSKEKFLEKNQPLLNQSLIFLKQDGKNSDLVHYFLARQLMFGLINTMQTGNSEQQKVGGWTMMLALASVKNPFAEKFVHANKSVWSFLLD